MLRFPVKARYMALVLPRTHNLTVFITICLFYLVLMKAQSIFAERQLTIEDNEIITRLAGGTKGEKGWSNPYKSHETQVDPTSQITITLNMIPPTSANVRYTGDLGDFLLDYNGPEASDKDAIIDHETFIVEKGVYTVTELARPQWYVQNIACNTPSATLLGDRISVRINTATVDQAECIFTTYHKSTISALIFHDLDGNRLRSLHEPYLASTTVRLYDGQLNLIASDVTTATGRASFKALQQGSYTLCEEIPQGFNNSCPNPLHPTVGQPCYTIDLQPGRSVTGVYGNTNLATIHRDAGMDESTLIDLPVEELYFRLDNGQYGLVEVDPWDWSLWTDDHPIYLPLIIAD